MKHTFTLLLLLASTCLAAQSRYFGVFQQDGGGVYAYEHAANTVQPVYRHQVAESMPVGTLSKGPDGKLYGTTARGGFEKYGAIFSYDAATGNYQRLYAFESADGVQPTGHIAWGSDGRLYGLATYGGTNNEGVLFSFDPATRVFRKLFDFGDVMGAHPMGGLYRHNNGMFYGVAQMGGANGAGVLFSFNPANGAYRKLYDFDEGTGAYPMAGLTAGVNNKLYGTTTYGGPEEWNAGTLFCFDPASATLQHQYFFDMQMAQGHLVTSALTRLADGKLYGVAGSGGTANAGVLFRFDPVTRRFSPLYSFDGLQGHTPAGGLVAGAGGRLYGMMREGGSGNAGVFYAFTPSTNQYAVVYELESAEGAFPAGEFCAAGDGRLYGVTPSGGTTEYGVLFSFDPAVAQYRRLRQFDEAPDGATPVAGLLLHTDGLYYGSTIGGGIYGGGVIYTLNPATNQYTVVYRFGAADGRVMTGGFTRGAGGLLYGLLNQGGNGVGVLFSFDPATKTFRQLHVFADATGAYPYGPLLPGDDGRLYAVTGMGGSHGKGTLFAFDVATGTYTVLHHFSGADGDGPGEGLAYGPGGSMYGVCRMGGSTGAGVLFRYDAATRKVVVVHSFSGTDGRQPAAPPVLGRDGNWYGVTTGGGSSDMGVMYRYEPAAGQLQVLHQFTGADGAEPAAALTQAADGSLHGFAYRGGAGNLGTLFSFNPQTSLLAKKMDFAMAQLGLPAGGALTGYCATMLPFYRDGDSDGYGNTAVMVLACVAPPLYGTQQGDCNDAARTSFPGAAELCGNGIDDDCDGLTDEACSGKPLLAIAGISVREAQREAILTVRLSQPARAEVRVQYKALNGSALAGRDFTMVAGMLRIPAGRSSAQIRVPITADRLQENSEHFFIALGKAWGADVQTATAKVTILDSKPAADGSAIAGVDRVEMLAEDAGLVLNAYPNPSRTSFTLQVAGGGALQLSVSDPSGRVVARWSRLMAGQTVTIGADLPPGLYLVHLLGNGRQAVTKLIKQP